MRIEINPVKINIQGEPTEALLSHNGSITRWNIGIIDKTSYGGEFDLFAEINTYWSHLPIATQNKIFNVYVKIENAFSEIWETTELIKALYELVAELFSYHELADIRHWVDFHSNLIIPDSLKETFKESYETPGTREKTYLREDYKWLITLSVAFRIMIPVWGEFIQRTKKEIGTTFKEYYACKLLAKSNVWRSEPMERLRVYVEHSIPSDKSKSSAILDGISSEDYPEWILGQVLVRRLTVGNVLGIDPSAYLVAFIYKYIGAKVKGHDNNFMGLVKDKLTDGQGQDSETNLSKLEGYKAKQQISDGDIVILSHYNSNPYIVLEKLCADVPVGLLEQSLMTIKQLESRQILEPQIVLTQLVLGAQSLPRGLRYMNNEVLKAMAVAQVLLWHKGFFQLAGLVSAIDQSSADVLSLDGTNTLTKILPLQLERLDQLYPYAKRPTSKQKVQKRINVAVECIDLLAAQFSEYAWRLTLPNEWVSKVTGNPNNRRYSTPHDMKIILANFTIAVAEKTF